VKIALLIEGQTEKALLRHLRHLRRLLEPRVGGNMPRIDPVSYDGRIPKGDKLKRDVERLLNTGRPPADAVIALTDVYTGSKDFDSAADAKQKMRQWVGADNRFYPHAAQYDFEAWLLPYWKDIQRLAGHNKAAPTGKPELVNHQRPPSFRIKEAFRTGSSKRDYVKPRDAERILRDNDLAVAAGVCSELKAFVNTILTLCGGQCL
jgi:hypothetical protein